MEDFTNGEIKKTGIPTDWEYVESSVKIHNRKSNYDTVFSDETLPSNCQRGSLEFWSNNYLAGTDGVWNLDSAIEEIKGAFHQAIVSPNPFARPAK